MSNLDDLRIDAPVPRPRRRNRMPWVPVVLVVFAATLVIYFNRDYLTGLLLPAIPGASTPEASGTETESNVTAPPAQRGPVGSISAAGYLEVIPPGPTVVSTLISGRLSDLSVIPGQQVSEGDVLARLDSALLRQQASVLQSQVDLAKSRLELKQAGYRSEEISQARALLASAQADYSLASSNLNRSRELLDKGVISRQQFEADETALALARSAVDDATAGLELLEAGTRSEEIRIAEAELSASLSELSRVNWEIRQCTISAPHAGVVLEQLARPGDWLQPGTDNPASAGIVTIFDQSRIQAWVDVNQRDSGSLFVGQRVEMTTDARPQRIVSGKVSAIMPQANLQKNTVQAKISIDDVPQDFLPELSVKVVFLPDSEDHRDSASVSGNSAVTAGQGGA